MNDKDEVVEKIYTRCPACHFSTLVLNRGKLLCTWYQCPDPTLIHRLGEGENLNFPTSVGWQPISTVPKDGTWVLCFQEHEKGINIQNAHWTEDNVLGGRGWEYASYAYPTHWMPMISSPEE